MGESEKADLMAARAGVRAVEAVGKPLDALRPEEVGAQLVDLVLGGLLVRRSRATGLSDPAGRVARTVRACLAEVAAKETLPEVS